ncbi:MAG: hypothetical protein SFY56_14035 [Bacteroidota bacterium]|nr:hypothetical protein [Bacteroidota bacterium]
MKLFIKIFFILALALQTEIVQAQEPKTIKVKKESNLVKAVFDNTEFKLIVVDRFGNPKDNRIASFKLYVKTKKDTKEFQGFSNSLSPEMIKYLNKLKKSAKLFFTEINVEEDDTHLIKLPDAIDQWFPNCENCK